MATNKKITQLDEITPATWADDDVIAIVDISAQETKKIQLSTFRSATSGVSTLTASTPLTVDSATGDVTISVAINGGGTINAVFDEDNMASDSPTALATQQSIKAYVDSQVGTVDTLAEILTNGNTSGGTNIVVSSGDVITTNTINETTAASGVTIDSVLVKDGEVDGRDVSTDGTKLDTIETNADVTDTANVTAAGALMDSELTNIAAVKALNQGVATTDTPTFAGLVTAGNVDGRDVSADGAKLDGIEAGADVTDATNVAAAGALMDSELTNIAAVKALNQGVATTDTPTFAGLITSGNVDGRDVSADGAKLDGIEAGADVTDATNVTAAGALMDSELTDIAAVKALNQGVATGDSPSFSALTLSGGNLLFSSAAKGVYLGVTSATAANLLDDYEEGDWTPTIGQGATASSDATYNASFTAGQYTKVGRIVHCTATLRLTDKGTQSGAISVCGLPFASANNVKFRATWSCWFHGAADIDLSGNTNGTIMLYQAQNTSHILVRVKDPATAAAENVEFADISDTVYLQISGSYVAA